jgi:hypothetical protein
MHPIKRSDYPGRGNRLEKKILLRPGRYRRKGRVLLKEIKYMLTEAAFSYMRGA